MCTPALALASAVLSSVAGCGDQTDYANEPRPPSPVTVTASVSAQRVSISPVRVGGGPITLMVANLAADSLDVRVDPARASGPAASSGPINPGGTASISFDAKMGTYRISARGAPARPATLSVGRPRRSARNELTLP